MQKRIAALLTALPGEEAALLLSPVNRQYFTGFAASDGFLLVHGGQATFFTDSRYLEAAQRDVCHIPVLDSAQLQEQMSALTGQLLLESEYVTLAQLERLRQRYPALHISQEGRLDAFVTRLRAVKQPGEVQAVRAAQRIAEQAFARILSAIEPGKTERELARQLDFAMLELGADAVSFETIFVSGANSSLPHGVPTEKRLAYGDMITMDFGAVKDGYHSDMTRTVALGKAGTKQREVYETVLAAQERALACIRAGVTGTAVDAAARDTITAAGYGAYFGHSTGHGVGLEIHEAPTVSARNEAPLEPGNLITVEPGIYLPGEFGVRIEDMALVTADGCENLTVCPKELLEL